MREQSITLLWIGLCGALGCICRYLLSGAVYQLTGRDFPTGTLVVNLAGAFLIGFLMELSLRGTMISGPLRLGLTVGFLGGLTTFSTFSYETFRLLEEGQMAVALLNTAVSVILCFTLTWFGIVAARQL